MYRKSKNRLVLLGMVGVAVILMSFLIVSWLPREAAGPEVQPAEGVAFTTFSCDDICRGAGYLKAVKGRCVDITECENPFHPLIENADFCTELKVCCCL
jgi:hypothetical protein